MKRQVRKHKKSRNCGFHEKTGASCKFGKLAKFVPLRSFVLEMKEDRTFASHAFIDSLPAVARSAVGTSGAFAQGDPHKATT